MRSIRPRRDRRDEEPAPPAKARRLRLAAHPRFYAAQVGEPSLAGDLDAAVAHFEQSGRRDGARISGLFNPDVYRERLAARGLRAEPGVDPFEHWLTVGWDERIVPTVLFDAAFYEARHPDLAAAADWSFAQYLRAGCYAAGRMPTPFGPNHGAGPAGPGARERQDPPLVVGLLHRAADYDLTRTSWLEEGVARGVAKLAGLENERVRALVAKAAAIEPAIDEGPRERWVSWPPHTHPMVVPAARAEEVRRGLGLVRADTVVVVPGGRAAGPGLSAVARALAAAEPDGTVVVATTEGPVPPELPVGESGESVRAVDLSGPWAGLSDTRRVQGLLDVVRGVRPRRLVVAGSEVGWQLLASYGTTLSNELQLGAVLVAPTSAAADADFQACFDRLAWVVTDTEEQRDELVARYLLPEGARSRVLAPEDCVAGATWLT